MTGSITESGTYTTVHTVTVDASADAVYRIVADVTTWPYTFEPTVHAEQVETDGQTERIQLWALANGAVRSWTSCRHLDPDALHVRFEQEVSPAPVLSMGGEWQVRRLGPESTRVDLLHHFRTLTPESVEQVTRAVNTNSEKELAALARAVAPGVPHDGLVLSFTDSVTIAAGQAEVYDFLYRADLWPQRLPHVSRLDLTQNDDGTVQTMAMDTRSTDGSVHTTRSIRVCFPHSRIVYKQTATPEIMAAHVGEWTFTPSGAGVEATSRHTVVIRPEKVTEVLGPGGTVGKARELIRHALGTNSLTTLRQAKAAVESGTGS